MGVWDPGTTSGSNPKPVGKASIPGKKRKSVAKKVTPKKKGGKK